MAKAEYLDKGENPRFVVTSLSAAPWAAQDLYEKFYCARGEMENRIKEQMCLFADRLSTDEMKGSQLPAVTFAARQYSSRARICACRHRQPDTFRGDSFPPSDMCKVLRIFLTRRTNAHRRVFAMETMCLRWDPAITTS